MSNTTSKVPFDIPGYCYRRAFVDDSQFLKLKETLEAKAAKGEPIYVCFKDKRREGSIGKLVSFDFQKNRNKYYVNSFSYHITNLIVKWDERKNVVRPESYEIYWLDQYEGPTVWAWDPQANARPKKPSVIPYDHLGEELKPGQFVSFIHRRYGVISLKFGTVTRTNDNGSVWAKTLKLRDDDSEPEEVKLYSADSATIINDNLMSRLVMARLRTQ